ncbi:MAG: serine hydrolase [Lachnospiraceae bacterium]|nr:serine hydrolase [Lachnospiraceae bacterium]
MGLYGCGEVEVKNQYQIYADTASFGIVSGDSVYGCTYFTDDKCPYLKKNRGVGKVESQVADGGGLFNLDTKEIKYAKNINKRMYPASTTKLLTAYTALKYGSLDQYITVTENAMQKEPDSSVCNLAVGDVLTLQQLLYGLMLRSGNDAAVAIAEGVGGSVDHFMELMNQEAKSLGATNSHFVTPNGLHDDNHYTTIYDMYLITSAAVKNQDLLDIISATSVDVSYKGADGADKQQQWLNTCQYLSGKSEAPDGITVIGAKTGTTGQAGYCLVTYGQNEKGEHLICIVYKADSRWNLYYLMNQVYDVFGR